MPYFLKRPLQISKICRGFFLSKINLTKTSSILLITLLIGCNSIPKIYSECSKIDEEIDKRHSLFQKLDQIEIDKRAKIEVPTFSKLEEISVFSKIVESVKKADPDSKLIAVDLRNYDSVNLGNIIVSNIKTDIGLKSFLRTSKYSQGFFSIINFGQNKITLIEPNFGKEFFHKQIIERPDLQDVELVLNVENSNKIAANMKFSKNQKISLLAKNVRDPFEIDLREAANHQFHLGNKWIMSVYDISKSEIKGGKDTGGYYLYVNNDQVKKIKVTKFDKSSVACYKKADGLKFENQEG